MLSKPGAWSDTLSWWPRFIHSSPLKLSSEPKAALSQRSASGWSPPWLLPRLLLESVRCTSEAPAAAAAAVPSRLPLARSCPGNRRSCGGSLADGTTEAKAKDAPGPEGRWCMPKCRERRLAGAPLLPPPASGCPALLLREGVGGGARAAAAACPAAALAASGLLLPRPLAPAPTVIHAGRT